MSELKTDVCIVGGGPSGMLLGLLLAKRGVHVHVLERASDFEREYRGELFQPRFMQMLDQLGLLSYIEKFPHVKMKHGAFYVHDRQVATIDFHRVYSKIPYALSMSQPVLLQALYDKAATFPTFRMSFNAAAKGLVRKETAVTGVAAKIGDEEITILAKITVGADGRFSSIRRMGNFELEYEHHRMDLIWFTMEHPADWEHLLRFQISTGPVCVMGPKSGNRLQVGIAFKKEEWENIKKQGIEAFKQTIANIHPRFRNFASSLYDFKAFTPLQAKLFMVKQWAHDGVLLIGDAAHCATPIGAVGVSLSCSTAVVAADAITHALLLDDVSAARLSNVQTIREPEIRAIHTLQKRIENIMVDNPVIRKIRPIAIQLIAKSPIFKKIQKKMLLMPTELPADRMFTF